jgi:hypothetical protein
MVPRASANGLPDQQNGGYPMVEQNSLGSIALSIGEMDQNFLLRCLVGAALALIVLMGLALAFSAHRRKRVVRQGQMSERDLLDWRKELVEAVGEASKTRGASVSLRGFRQESGLSKAQFYVVLQDLLKRQVFYCVYSSDKFVAFFQHVRWDFFHLPVTVVRLSEQNWQRLTNGTSAGIVANGDVILVQDSPGAGVVSRSTNVTQSFTREVSPDFVGALAQALRADSAGLVPGHALREQAESYADTLERDAAAGRWTSVRRTACAVLEFTANGMGLWAATIAILAAT